MKKRIVIGLAFAVAFVQTFTGVNLYQFHHKIINGPIDLEYNMGVYGPEPTSIQRGKTKVIENKNYFVSDYFVMPCESQMQIRFRLVYTVPFMHADIFGETGFHIEDEKGNDLTSTAMVYPETFMGLSGMNVTLVFTKDIPSSGDRLFLKFTSAKDGKNYAYSNMEIVIP